MPRRKNPVATLVMLVALLAFGWASWHYLVEEKILTRKGPAPAPPAAEIARLQRLCNEALEADECYDGISAFNWRENGSRYRVDVQIRDGCSRNDAKRLARRLSDIVERASDGYPAEVGVLVLGREVWHFVP